MDSAVSQPGWDGPGNWIDAPTAAKRLGVSRKTLYAYVSRKLIRSVNHPHSSKVRLYDAAELDDLLYRRAETRQIKSGGAVLRDRALPIVTVAMPTAELAHVEDGRLRYRNTDARELSESRSLEEVAALLWKSEPPNPFLGVEFRPEKIPGWIPAWRQTTSDVATERAAALMPWLLPRHLPDGEKWPIWSCGEAAWLVRGVATAIAGKPHLPTLALHEALAEAWSSEAAEDIIRRALVLSADQESCLSTTAVRLIATTGARIAPVLLAGISALNGPRHGGAFERIRALLFEVEAMGDASSVISARLERGDELPGFGHPLYPDGDPRAAAILAKLQVDERLAKTIEAVAALTHLRPSLELALLAVERRFRLPRGSALALFIIGRSVGWIAHALDQRKSGTDRGRLAAPIGHDLLGAL
ncbi:MAG: citrate synthase family protein [Alphaproteobacteria bacterium]|nr:citrate synthase family protein [Alphaproteobacteria bacterium]